MKNNIKKIIAAVLAAVCLSGCAASGEAWIIIRSAGAA